jgi:tryptophanyl-tRNA synthetase
MNAYLGELERTTTFKEKARQQPDNVNAGLLTYPTLMAADILLHRAHKVPVGKDQEQNMEMARRYARRFNTVYECDLFPEPASFSLSRSAIKIPGLDGSGKMGKSEGNAIYLVDDDTTIRKKVMKAVTDTGPTAPDSPKPEAIQNLFTIMEVVSAPDVHDHFNEQYNRCAIRYGDLKKQLAEDIIAFCTPIRERVLEYASDVDYMDKVAALGADKARESANRTLKEVRRQIGFRS